MHERVTVNGRDYAWPKRPVVAVCLDGSEPAYTDEAVAAGVMPWLAAARESGTMRPLASASSRRSSL